MMAFDITTDRDLLLIGKTGNGKSSTGNSILKRRAFESKCSTTSVTTFVQYEVAQCEGRVIKVVDGPGIGDTRMDNQKAVEHVITELTCAVSANTRGYHAFLLVVKFGGRFTAEDKDTIDFLKKIFGKTFVKNFCILVVTNGDSFENESEETGQNFQEWCRDQTGVFQDLLQECQGRAVLFNNRTKDEKKRNAQIHELLNMVDNLVLHGHRYTDEYFNLAEETRQRVMIEASIPLIREEMNVETSLILQELGRINSWEDPYAKIPSLQELQDRTKALLDSLTSQDRGSGALHELCDTVRSMLAQIKDQTEDCKKMVAHIEEMSKQREEMERQAREDKHQMESEHQQQLLELENQRRQEAEEREKKLQKELEERELRNKQALEDLERRYREAKQEDERRYNQMMLREQAKSRESEPCKIF